MSRRNVIKKSIVGSAGILVAPTIVPSSVFGKNAPSNKIHIGQIGFGRIAQSHDLPDTLKYDIARVVAVSDVDGKRAQLGKEYVEEIGRAHV